MRYRVVVQAVYSEVYEVEADSESDIDDVLYDGNYYNVESECIESDIIEIKQLEEANNG